MTIRCAEPGCSATVLWGYDSKREYVELRHKANERPWRCTRHEEPEKVLRPDNPTVTGVLISEGNYWREKDRIGGSGFAYGPGFKAHVADFPVGTRIIVTAQVELPIDRPRVPCPVHDFASGFCVGPCPDQRAAQGLQDAKDRDEKERSGS